MLLTAMFSILKHHKNNFIYFYIIHNSDVDKKSISNIEKFNTINSKVILYKFNERLLDNAYIGNSSYKIPKVALYRMFVPYIFPELKKFLYLDIDTLVVSNLFSFYNKSLKNNIIAGVEGVGTRIHEPYKSLSMRMGFNKLHPFISTGVMIVDCDKYREFISKKELINLISDISLFEDKFFIEMNKDYEAFEELITLLNDNAIVPIMFKNKTKFLSHRYNYQIKMNQFIPKEFVILHFNNPLKPFKKIDEEKYGKGINKFMELYLKYYLEMSFELNYHSHHMLLESFERN
jgi:lipopolysaccharide biosynthesis glycosyltransferase